MRNPEDLSPEEIRVAMIQAMANLDQLESSLSQEDLAEVSRIVQGAAMRRLPEDFDPEVLLSLLVYAGGCLVRTSLEAVPDSSLPDFSPLDREEP